MRFYREERLDFGSYLRADCSAIMTNLSAFWLCSAIRFEVKTFISPLGPIRLNLVLSGIKKYLPVLSYYEHSHS